MKRWEVRSGGTSRWIDADEIIFSGETLGFRTKDGKYVGHFKSYEFVIEVKAGENQMSENPSKT